MNQIVRKRLSSGIVRNARLSRPFCVGKGSEGRDSEKVEKPTKLEQDSADLSQQMPPTDVENKEDEKEMVEMWNPHSPGGPEWAGPRGYEPTRYGDWSKNGRVSDF